MAITDRTAGVWGGGQGSDLAAAQIDENFWELESAILVLQENASNSAGIDYFVVEGNQLFVHLTDHVVIGPYTLPTAQWDFRGGWLPLTTYADFDVVTNDGSVYLVIWPHTSTATFNPNANDGMGHNYYGLLLSQPADELPAGGTVGQVLTKSTGSPYATEWVSPTRDLSLYIEGAAESSELVLQYLVAQEMTFPIGMDGSLAFAGTPPTTDQAYELYQNGVFIGSVNFTPSPDEVTFTFAAAVTFMPGDILTMIAPVHADAHMTNISFTFIATLP